MENNHVVSALKRQRAELAGLIPEAERRLESLRQALAGVDTTLRLFDRLANPEDIKPRRSYKRRATVFAHKELSRLVMGALREAEGPISARAIAGTIAVAKGSGADECTIARSVGAALNGMLKRGVVVRTGEDGAALWERVV